MADWDILLSGSTSVEVEADQVTFENGFIVLKSGGDTVFIGKPEACTRKDKKKAPPSPSQPGATGK